MTDEDRPTTVTFEVKKDQVWIDAGGIAWYVTSVGPMTTVLERTVVETVPTRDLVRAFRQMNEDHPLHAASRDSQQTKETP